ncbi:zinc-binding dehydrogenase [Actinoallomurus iriomotensis]|uniref:NADPH:quinone reductase n=1 Tax=Actinoallomurus iriomotensis TaxID=478107 RepID=A0A9W6W6G1_9ACTN|nr:zinc-binding dehydrogenase [Actinoallomurus iriomotensis]GLY91026.1 NADPH:quinone reductase [Actinoallomurus iriomotensis]
MRVIQVERFGGPEVLVPTDAPDPVAGPGQAVVRVSAADVGFVETQIRAGAFGEYFTVTPPYVPGHGVTGVVTAVGDGADPAWVGRRVAGYTGEHGGRGGYAERAVIEAAALVPVPDGLALRDAAALLHDGVTALRLFDVVGVRAGEQALVTAAAGGMGLLLVQLAHAAGARVIGAARGRRKLALVGDQGAELVVDYSEPDWADRVREATGGTGADVVLDGAGGAIGRAAFEVTARGGRFSAHGAPSGGFAALDSAEAEKRGITVSGIGDLQLAPEQMRQVLTRALAEAAEGRMRPVIGQTFPLERAADAHAAIEAREVVGRTLLLAGPPE